MYIDLSCFNNKIFFISDLHLGHSNIIKLSNRPFRNVEEMNNTLIENWNDIVDKNDIVFHLGDFAWNSNIAKSAWRKLNGKIYLIKGNHDHKILEVLPFQQDSIVDIKYKKQYISMCHYPMHRWYKSSRDGIHLYGHTHRPSEQIKNAYNVCVENINYTPISFEELIRKHEDEK